ncbi:MAG: hypothetical protein WB611_19990 [Stellaceae bacterium]
MGAIRDGELYRQRYNCANFAEYCVERWELTDRRAQQIMAAASFAEKTNNCSLSVPSREGHVRPLSTHRAGTIFVA